jgi:molybdopterin converting factor small subunit
LPASGLRNGREWIHRDQMNPALKDGDDVMLLMMMAGG